MKALRLGARGGCRVCECQSTAAGFLMTTKLALYFSTRHCIFAYQATLKKSLFPVQRVAEIMASRAAAKSFFFLLFFLLW